MSRLLGGKFLRRAIHWHEHSLCGHLCPCPTPILFACQDCREVATARVNTALSKVYPEDRMTVEQLLDRRA